jgi:hypothetical protein
LERWPLSAFKGQDTVAANGGQSVVHTFNASSFTGGASLTPQVSPLEDRGYLDFTGASVIESEGGTYYFVLPSNVPIVFDIQAAKAFWNLASFTVSGFLEGTINEQNVSKPSNLSYSWASSDGLSFSLTDSHFDDGKPMAANTYNNSFSFEFSQAVAFTTLAFTVNCP